MKFPIAFLSLLTTAAYAQHEPKSLRGSVEDFDFLEVENNVVTIPPGSKATIRNCGPSDQCCLQDGSHCSISDPDTMVVGGGPICLSDEGTVEGAGNCVLSCSGTCNPALEVDYDSSFDEEDQDAYAMAAEE